MTLETLSTGIKFIGGTVVAHGVKAIAEAGVQIIIDHSPELRDNPFLAEIGKQSVSLCAGMAATYCVDKKVDSLMEFVGSVKKALDEVSKEEEEKEETKEKEVVEAEVVEVKTETKEA